MKGTLITAILLLVGIACFPMGKKKLKRLMDGWLNHSAHELIVSWGPPNQTTSDGDGGEVLIYSSRVYRGAIPMSNGNSMPAVDYYDNRMFYAHRDGTIYSWRTSSTPNPPQQVDVYLH